MNTQSLFSGFIRVAAVIILVAGNGLFTAGRAAARGPMEEQKTAVEQNHSRSTGSSNRSVISNLEPRSSIKLRPGLPLAPSAAGFTVTPTSGLVTTESGGTATFTVQLTQVPTDTVTIDLVSSDTTEGTVSPASMTFTTMDPQTATVTGVNDPVADGNQSYTIVISAAVSNDPAYNGLDPDDVAVTNHEPGVTVNPTSISTNEGGSPATFTIVLTGKPAANVTVNLSSGDTTEGIVSPLSMVFTPDNWNQTQEATITPVDDKIADGNVLYLVVTNPASSTDQGYDGLNPNDVQVNNVDNDTAGINVTPTSGLQTSEDGSTAFFLVSLNSQPLGDVYIGLSSSLITEGVILATDTITFTTATWDTNIPVTVAGVDDLVADGDVPYKIVTAPAVSGDPGYNGMNAPDVSVTNNDNETAGITITPQSGTTSEAGGTFNFTVVLNTLPTDNVTVNLSSSDLSEGTVSPTSMTFTKANAKTPQTATVTGLGDFLDDGNMAYKILITVTSNAMFYKSMDPDDISATNNDDDTAGYIVNPTSGLVTSESGITDTFTVKLTSQPTGTVTINLSSSNSLEGVVTPSSLVFDNSNWNAVQTATVTGQEDTPPVADGQQAYTIILASTSSTDLQYKAINPPDVSAANTDNDAPGITVSPTSGLVTSEAGGTATFTVRLNTMPTDSHTVNIGLSSSLSSEGTITTTLLTFTPANWSVTQVVTVTGVDDGLDDGDKPYMIITDAAISDDEHYNGLQVPDVSLTNTNDDFTPVAENDSYMTNATIDKPLKVNKPGVLGNDSDANPNATLQAILNSSTLNGTLTLRTDGSFDYTPKKDFVGGDAFTYHASDGGLNSQIVNVTLTVDPILPVVAWTGPVENTRIMNVYSDTVKLSAQASDSGGAELVKVVFYRWDAEIQKFVDIFHDYEPPFEIPLDISDLNYGWNQIFAMAFDSAGNASERHHIWLVREYQIRTFLPTIPKGVSQ